METESTSGNKKNSKQKGAGKGRAKKSQSKQSVSNANDNDDTATCVKCYEVFTDQNDKLMLCERCENWFCTNCLQMDDDVYSVMVDRKDLHWFCEECEKPAITAVRTDKEIEERCAAYMSSITHRLDDIENKLSTKADIVSVNDLESRVTSLEGTNGEGVEAQAGESVTTVSVSDTIAEQKEREYRANNIMIYNIPESQSSEAGDRIKEDVDTVERILAALDIEDTDVIEKCVRIGKKDSGKID